MEYQWKHLRHLMLHCLNKGNSGNDKATLIFLWFVGVTLDVFIYLAVGLGDSGMVIFNLEDEERWGRPVPSTMAIIGPVFVVGRRPQFSSFSRKLLSEHL